MTDAQNRKKWAIDQQRKARAAFVAPDQTNRLAELRALAEMLARPEFRHMAETLATAQAEIDRLTREQAQ